MKTFISGHKEKIDLCDPNLIQLIFIRNYIIDQSLSETVKNSIYLSSKDLVFVGTGFRKLAHVTQIFPINMLCLNITIIFSELLLQNKIENFFINATFSK